VKAGNQIFVTGYGHRRRGEIVCVGDAYGQTVQAISNIEERSRPLARVSQALSGRAYLLPTSPDGGVWTGHGEFFAAIRPCTTMVEVSRLVDDRYACRGRGGRSAVKRTNRRQSWLWPLPILFVAIGLDCRFRSPDAIERYYSRGIFKYITLMVGGVAGIVPFSLAEFLGLLAVLGNRVVGWQLRLLLVRIGPSDLVLRVSLRFVQAGSIALLLFLLIWGLNYQRLSLTDNLHLSRDSPSGANWIRSGELINGVNLNYNSGSPRGPQR
jgi:hypothetical protein